MFVFSWSHNLNKAVCRQNYTISTSWGHLAGVIIFILDKKDGYWQVKLDKETSWLCTLILPWGRFCFHHLPFELKSSSEVFQQKQWGKWGNIWLYKWDIYDSWLYAYCSKDSQRACSDFPSGKWRLCDKNIQLNRLKIQFKVVSVKYMGHILIAVGLMRRKWNP